MSPQCVQLVQLSLLLLARRANAAAQPKGFTDDPYVNDDKFTEKGTLCIFVKFVFFYLLNF